MKVGRQAVGIRGEAVLPRHRAVAIIAGQVPARPVGFAQRVVIVERLDGPLDEEMCVIVGVSRGPGGIAKLHLQGGIDGCRGQDDRQQQQGETRCGFQGISTFPISIISYRLKTYHI